MIHTTNAADYPPLFRTGKVRDTYDLGDRLLMVASDRLSAFDVVLPSVIPGKGVLLTQLSHYWFDLTGKIVPNHLLGDGSVDTISFPNMGNIQDRAMLVRKAKRIDVECVVRGCLAGSGWREYAESQTLAGRRLPERLRQCERLPAPVFTPALKNDAGHDENISVADLENAIGGELTGTLEALSLKLFAFASATAEARGLILADTKFEFGFIDGALTLIDEALTPDSSRYWDAQTYQPGHDQESFDKQFVRNWLVDSGWNREAPGPILPEHVIQETQARYQSAFERITTQTVDSYIESRRRNL